MEEEVVGYIRDQVPDWDDEVKARARFKGFSGLRSDWEPQFHFWRDLIIKIARRFNLVFLYPSLMKNTWFNIGGLTPLCLDHVLLEMYKAGDFLRMSDLGDPTTTTITTAGRLSQLLKKLLPLIYFPTSSTSTPVLDDDRLILRVILEDKADNAVKALSETETHSTSSCIITMKKYQSLFTDQSEAHVVLSYLSGLGKARYLSITKKEMIEGVKLSLSSAAASGITNVDSAILQLVWTLEDLEQQLLVIDQQYKRLRKSALAALRSGDKILALRNARQLKLASENREKLSAFVNRVEDVLQVLTSAETSKKVLEAVQLGAQAMKENSVQVDEVQSCLQELDEFKNSQEILYRTLESTSSMVEDEDLEEELNELESEIREDLIMTPKSEEDAKNSTRASVAPDSLCAAMVDLKLECENGDPYIHESATSRSHTSPKLEAA